ncbi:PHP domain-containing protein [Candidatus Peregrinibacteria bacterium]|nr:PHP domain-containing protein [Candidatus Peregrinibacteria bacterium]
MLKIQLHCHCYGDPVDHINYSPKKLIDEAKRLDYDVLCITLHRRLLFNKKLQKYAAKKRILLLPGIEFEINGKHILAINAHADILNVNNFKKLSNYRQNHCDTLIIAPHPFFPTNECLKKDLTDNIALFDAIEISWAYTKTKNYNKKAIELAKKFNKPLIATSDCHILSHLDNGFTFVEAKKDPRSFIEAVRKNKMKISSKPTSYLSIIRFFGQLFWQNFYRKLKKSKNKI